MGMNFCGPNFCDIGHTILIADIVRSLKLSDMEADVSKVESWSIQYQVVHERLPHLRQQYPTQRAVSIHVHVHVAVEISNQVYNTLVNQPYSPPPPPQPQSAHQTAALQLIHVLRV